MTAIDWILATVLVASFLLGLWRGLVYEVLSLAGWVIAFLLAQWWAQDVADRLPFGQPGDSARYAAGFVIVFVAAAFGCGLVASLLRRLVTTVGLGPVDRTLGAAFGLVRAAVLLLALAVVVETTALRDSAWWQESQAAPLLRDALDGVKPVLPAAFGQFFP
ncbi:CvpA family protein [uncultured Xylophilus sp.]|uniref:CvpA family protein n=1 Tax=uncultured Xylophilus sp. TaxID=296832 RepID=UPI0025D6244A|nr:CvpA family protein [uncultured Xylophilus sp.]